MADLEFGPMADLSARDVRYIVVHTAAAPGAVDQSAESIHAYHRSRGWSGIGYHAVIRKDGTVEDGRPVIYQGAHVRGLNDRSLGVCVTGHGDIEPFTPAQMRKLARHISRWMKEYSVPLDHVLGHRECGALPGVPDPGKTCPGTQVDMEGVRDAIAAEVLEGARTHWGPPAPLDVEVPILSFPDVRERIPVDLPDVERPRPNPSLYAGVTLPPKPATEWVPERAPWWRRLTSSIGDKMRAIISRIVAPIIALLVTWLTSMGLDLGPEFAASATDTAVLLLMAVFTGLYGIIHKLLDKKINPADDAA